MFFWSRMGAEQKLWYTKILALLSTLEVHFENLVMNMKYKKNRVLFCSYDSFLLIRNYKLFFETQIPDERPRKNNFLYSTSIHGDWDVDSVFVQTETFILKNSC